MRSEMPRAAPRPTNSENSVNLVLLYLLNLLSWFAPLGSDKKSLFQVTLHENGSLHGQWPRIWAGAGGEPSDAEEQLPLFQDVILFRRQQSLTADSLIWRRSRKVQQDRQSFHQRFLHHPDEWHPNSCWKFSFTKRWSLRTTHVPPMLSFFDALLRV